MVTWSQCSLHPKGLDYVGWLEVRTADQHRLSVQLRRRRGPRRVPLRRVQGVPAQLGPRRERALFRQGKGTQYTLIDKMINGSGDHYHKFTGKMFF